MRLTWRDGITTLTMLGAIVLERAYFHNWDWPLVSNLNWVIAGLALLAVIGLGVGVYMDRVHDNLWLSDVSLLGLAIVVLTSLGFIYDNSDYAVWLMLTNIVVWVASITKHLVIPERAVRRHA